MSCMYNHIQVPEGLSAILFGLLDIALTIIGLVPAPVPIVGQVGLVADALAVVLNTLLDDPFMTVLSVISLVPVAGEFGGAIKIACRVARILQQVMGNPFITVAIAVLSLLLIGGVYYFIYYL